MRNFARILFALTLMFTALNCAGQTTKRQKRKATKTRTQPKPDGEIFIPTGTLPYVDEPVETRKVGAVGVDYYPDRDETNVSTGFEVHRQPPLRIMLTYFFKVKGKDVVRPESVEVVAESNVFVFREGAGMIIEADGNRFAFKPDTAVCAERKCTNARASVDFATFEKIANSGSVVVHAAPYTFALNEYGLAATRDVVRAVEPTPKKP